MKVVSIKKPGNSKELEMQERPIPKPEMGQLLVKVKASAINRTDIMTRENRQLPEPYPILGIEVAGVVVENQDSSNNQLVPGTRVAGLVNHGGYAEYVVMPADRAIRIPDNMSFEEAAAIPEVFLTAYQTLYWLGELESEETVLIHAGASGVGTAAIQLAKKMTKAKVIVTAGSTEKLQFCKELGADKLINYKEEEFDQLVLEYTEQKGVDLILDFVGASYWEKNLNSLKTDGRWVVIGVLGGAVVENVNLGMLLQKRITLKGTLLTPRSDDYKAQLTNEFIENVLPYFEKGLIKPIVDIVFPLDEVAKAHQYMEENKNSGKIILKIED
ncbi:quinone oxidoreductase [Carnobacterium sp. AT7]|uniref:NAD(P)H-quinone oxidoreductase n=1 Tax=Carnobacterium TaxID=2747 RepID=UPI00015F2AFC|nr:MULTISPECIES: NAD(P)H-quinone oxidoreductase [Carnobacterium]EDP68945.1 quinone oxidoreductase [Carnobacterium sp. AT7]